MATNDQVNRELVDEALNAYLDWREERAHVWDAYARWESAEHGDASFAFSAYRAALDREEHASRVYAALVAEITVAGGDQEPVASIRGLLPW
jgi:hypothetical protein